MLIYHPKVGYTHFRRCDYQTEEDYNRGILKYFRRNPSIYFTFNGANFDHILLNRILRQSHERPMLIPDGKGIRRMKWGNNMFLDALYWLPPCSLSELGKTWLGEDLKDVFPYNSVKEEMVVDKDSKLGMVSDKDFSER